ncbi:hypothetical protein ACFQV2_39785 [Actinokineospora soli]|uniref:Lipoprotein n=1 Tax=Actinokineospora soli TaxID=1048753 RepID=A0ABW2TXD3_9PSEU
MSGNGRGCNTLTGTFVVQAAEYGPNGYVKTFDATYEQHCEGYDSALRGEVHIANPEPPAPLELGVRIATSGTADTLNGNAHVTGTATCTAPTTVHVATALTQVVKQSLARGSAGTSLECVPGTVHTWALTITPTGDVPFVRGDAEARVSGWAYDPAYEDYVRVDETVAIKLGKK